MAHAIRIDENGGPDAMQLVDIDEPKPDEGQVAVEVAAAGVNFIDVYQRSGVYQLPLPLTLGREGAGTVTALGPGVEGLAVGDRIAWPHQPGSYASHAVVAADGVVPVPDAISLETAAAAMLQGLTAHYLVRSTYPVQPGDAVLIHAAAGGVGALVVQLAKAAGARVIATASTAEKRAIAKAAGADEVIGYDGFADTAREFADGVGVHAVYDGVGKDTFDDSMACLRPRGYLVLFGGSSGQVPPFDPQRLNSAGSLFLTRPTLAHYIATPDELRWRTSELFDAIAAGALEIRVGHSYPIGAAADAHRDLEGRKTTGKLLLIP
jgi:NADPH:quinone reductase